MNALIDSVIAFQDFLKKEGIPVMAIGGIAVAVWGEPRLTRDIEMNPVTFLRALRLLSTFSVHPLLRTSI